MNIVELYSQGYSHEQIVEKSKIKLETVRAVISKATKDNETLYLTHKNGGKLRNKGVKHD